MKKIKCTLLLLLGSTSLMIAQIGINTSNPTTTLDITAKNATGTTTSVDGLLIPRVDRQRAQSMLRVPVSTLIYVNSIDNGTQSGTTANVDTIGYYYYNGSIWVKLNSRSGSDVNIYTADGTLTGNRIVTQGNNALTFNSNITNGFSVDGSTFSVDAVNDRIGIGTTAPSAKLDVNGNMRLGTANAATDTNFSTVVRDNSTGEIKVSTSTNSIGTPINYMVYTLNNPATGDYIQDFDTKIPTSNYTVVITGTEFINSDYRFLASTGANFNPYSSRAFSSNGTWRLFADFRDGKPANLRGTWKITCLIISNKIVKTLPEVSYDMGGGSTGSASAAPSGL